MSPELKQVAGYWLLVSVSLIDPVHGDKQPVTRNEQPATFFIPQSALHYVECRAALNRVGFRALP
jgi:hypothetical protein